MSRTCNRMLKFPWNSDKLFDIVFIIGRSRGCCQHMPPPTGSISFVFAYIFAKMCMHRRLAPPQWEILDLPLFMFGTSVSILWIRSVSAAWGYPNGHGIQFQGIGILFNYLYQRSELI